DESGGLENRLEQSTWVRIPPSPPFGQNKQKYFVLLKKTNSVYGDMPEPGQKGQFRKLFGAIHV
ncbi:13500_t:CDS:1, partial [Racocetra persica]